MDFDEKVDVIDLIINVLREHEKTLDELIYKLEALLRGAPIVAESAEHNALGPSVSILLRRWDDFCERCSKAKLVAFDLEEKRFEVSALKEGILHFYREEIPDMNIRFSKRDENVELDGKDIRNMGLLSTALRGRLECGLEISVRGTEMDLPNGGAVYKVVYEIDTDEARSWLSSQLDVENRNILHGKVQS